MNKLAIIGAGGHGKVAADVAFLNGYKDIVFLDDDETVKRCGSYPVVGGSERAGEMDRAVFVAVGNGKIRKELCVQFRRSLVTLIHPSAVIAKETRIGAGTVVMAGAIINPGTVVGEGVIINTAASVDHDCVIGDFVHVAVGAHLAGTVCVGAYTWVGAGATISNNLTIYQDCVIGAGAVVIRDIKEPGTYMGVPARKAGIYVCTDDCVRGLHDRPVSHSQHKAAEGFGI